MTTLDYSQFDTLTFDCYGTLIDWETGIVAALRPVQAARGLTLEGETLLAAFGRHEAAVETGAFRPYRDVLRETLTRIGEEFGFTPTPGERDRFADSVGDWPPFPDTVAALRTLKARLRLAVLSNVDDDLFARTAARLTVPFDAVITAQQVTSYKPAPRHFERAEAQLGLDRRRWLHVAQSLYHDIAPAKAFGLATVWVDRRAGRAGGGATPPAAARPDLIVPDLATLAQRVKEAFR